MIISNYNDYSDGLNIEIKGLNFFNLFVGQNGAGKSRILKNLTYNKLFSSVIEFDNSKFDEEFDLIYSHAQDFIIENGLNIIKFSTITDIFFHEFPDSTQGNVSPILNKILSSESHKGFSSLKYKNDTFIFEYIDNTVETVKLSSGYINLFNLFIKLEKQFSTNKFYRGEHKIALIFDEIETSFHPSFVKYLPDFLTFWINQKKAIFTNIKFQIFLSSHSFFLIRSILKNKEWNIYHLEEGKVKSILSKESLPRNSIVQIDYLFRDLGFEMKDIFYPNCLIFVEGPSDIMYISYWLETYIKEKKWLKGIDFDFLTFGGALAAHFSIMSNIEEEIDSLSLINLFSLNRQVFFIVDDDRKKAWEKTKKRIEAEIREINNGSIFYRDENYSTIEKMIPKFLKTSKNRNKIKAAELNIKNWKAKGLKIENFGQGIASISKQITDFISKVNSK